MADNIDVLICDIITQELSISASRVVVYDGNWNPPKDRGLYIVVSSRRTKIMSSRRDFDDATEEEIKTIIGYTSMDIDVTSFDRSALERKEEVIMALTSQYSLAVQNENGLKVMRNGDLQDLSFIESASAMKRFRIPIIVGNIKEKRTSVDVFDKYRTVQEEIDE